MILRAFAPNMTRPFTVAIKIFIRMYMHGLRTPNEAFFHRNPKLLGLRGQIGQINFGAFWVFSANLSAPILALQGLPEF